jgi:hypothetical protein
MVGYYVLGVALVLFALTPMAIGIREQRFPTHQGRSTDADGVRGRLGRLDHLTIGLAVNDNGDNKASATGALRATSIGSPPSGATCS